MTIYYFTISVIAGLGFILTDKKKEKKKTVIYIILSFLILVFTASFRYAITKISMKQYQDWNLTISLIIIGKNLYFLYYANFFVYWDAHIIYSLYF